MEEYDRKLELDRKRQSLANWEQKKDFYKRKIKIELEVLSKNSRTVN